MQKLPTKRLLTGEVKSNSTYLGTRKCKRKADRQRTLTLDPMITVPPVSSFTSSNCTK